jgi:fructokinase
LLVSYDPNLRIDLWQDAVEAKEQILGIMSYADILKISEEELAFNKGCFYRKG